MDALYQSHAEFVSAWTRWTKSGRKAAFLVAADARDSISAAVESDVGQLASTPEVAYLPFYGGVRRFPDHRVVGGP